MTRLFPSLREFTGLDDFLNHDFDVFNYGKDLMNTDIKEKDGYYMMEVNLPGYQKEDIHISLNDGYITISASNNKNNEEKDSDGNIIRSERYSGSVSRSYYVGDGVSSEDVKAKYENGVLKVVLPSNKSIENNEQTIMIE